FEGRSLALVHARARVRLHARSCAAVLCANADASIRRFYDDRRDKTNRLLQNLSSEIELVPGQVRRLSGSDPNTDASPARRSQCQQPPLKGTALPMASSSSRYQRARTSSVTVRLRSYSSGTLRSLRLDDGEVVRIVYPRPSSAALSIARLCAVAA